MKPKIQKKFIKTDDGTKTKNVPVRLKKGDYSVQGQIFHEVSKNPGVWTNRILIGTPCTGSVRMEWVLAKYSQVTPANWSQVSMVQWMNLYAPMQYVLADAENLIAKTVVEGNYEWFLSIEEDNVLPPGVFVQLNEYMIENKVPIVSGLYFLKGEPTEPIMYRGRGNGGFRDFKLGDKVWVDGIPFGFCLIHGSIIRALWNESPEYRVGNELTRKVFSTPDVYSGSAEGHSFIQGTTDLNFCKRIMENDIFAKAGWPKYQKMKHPFLVDTNMLIQHIDRNGQMFPLGGVPQRYKFDPKRGKRELK